MSKKDTITIGEILEMQPGDKNNPSWVNGEFEAVCSDVKEPNGKGPATMVLQDPHNPGIAIVGNFFGGADYSRYAGKVCHFSGQGITRTEYKGTQGITAGTKCTIQVVGSAAPATATQRPAAGQHAAGPAPSGSPAVFGATVGMAINQAISLLKDQDGGLTLNFIDSPDFSRTVWTIASDIIRVARVLESGKLAQPAKDRADPEAAQRKAAEKAAVEEAARKAKEEEEARAAQAANQKSAASGSWAEQDGGDVQF